VLEILKSDYPQDMIERLINERLQKRLFKLWWEMGDDYSDALRLFRSVQQPFAAYFNGKRIAFGFQTRGNATDIFI
jgi:hypothetical protein